MNDERTELWEKMRMVLAEWGPEDAVAVLPAASGPPVAGVLEIRPAPLEDYPLPARLERMTGLLRAGGLEHRAVATFVFFERGCSPVLNSGHGRSTG